MNPRAVLAECPLFVRLDPVALDALAERAELVELTSGRTLIEPGMASTSVYIVAAGRLSAVLPDGSVAGAITRLEPVGEISALSGEPAVAAVHAVRDSLLVRIPADHLYEVLTRHPQALIEMTRVIIHRLRRNQRAHHRERQRQTRCFAVVPATPAIDVTSVARRFAQALSVAAACRPVLIDAAAVDAALGTGAAQTRIDGGEHNRRLVEHLNRIEAEETHLIYVAGGDADPWARRCMRQADRILFVVDTQTPPIATAMVDELLRCGARAPVDLVMLRPGGAEPVEVLRWRERVGANSHYYLRRDHDDDYASLARQLTGRGIGLVLGGGGARGFAHIGLVRALRELDIPVDLVGGSSMGAFFAALIACGYDHHEMAHIALDTFVRQNHLNDYLFPTVALIRGRKFVRRLHEIFDERRIEALRMPFFCVSTNLTRGAAVVHDRGPLHLWVATSMAVPGVAPPVVWREELLCDGAVVNSLPTDVMQQLERGPIIASDVSTEGGIAAPGIEGPDPEGLLQIKGEERPRLFSIMFRTATLTSESGTAQRAARADVYLRMPVSKIGMFDWKRMDEVVERGYRYAIERLGDSRERLLG
ncbi:patatin-like phospholipase family protein [Sinimarinibacterium thermocellulolyticum]|uniref:Patatin-like phospholipase family protein n=1 Tax=Sinimarinibacterium thermocellulolyticum TaxID=3170016 RepID=A0ABV2A9J6_9GAMM